MDGLTIQEAAQTTGWSARMLRYIERAGLIEPQRSHAGYRLYGPGELQRLRTLRELVTRFGIGLGEIGFAMRLRREQALAAAVDAWFEAEPRRPADVLPAHWLRWEQDKHTKLLALAAAATPATSDARPEEILTT
jgi:DNA-binding transcriptional MerR regulator